MEWHDGIFNNYTWDISRKEYSRIIPQNTVIS
jgi:hypothetical protein